MRTRAQIKMNVRSDMTTAAIALADALPGPVCLIIGSVDEKDEYLKKIPANSLVKVVNAGNLREMMKVMRNHILVIDDAKRCCDHWRINGEGELFDCLDSMTSLIPDFIISVYAFDYYD